MKHRLVFTNLLLFALSLAVVPTALASTKWYVDGVNGSESNNCKSRLHACKTIGHAISLAHSGDSIMIAAAIYVENLSIGIGLNIVGSGAVTTTIDGQGVDTVISIPGTSTRVTLSKLTIRNGMQRVGGGIYNSGKLKVADSTITGNHAFVRCRENCDATGGGIYTDGTLTISNSILSNNSAVATGCARGQTDVCINISFGGGIFSTGITKINNSTISENIAKLGGGGIYSGGSTTINNSTVSGNAAGEGGGIFICCGSTTIINNNTIGGNTAGVGGGAAVGIAPGTLTINNSTFSRNSAYSSGGGIFKNVGTVALRNSIVANSSSGGNCDGGMTSRGYNLSSDGTCNFNKTGDLNNTGPKLGQLGNHGGPTQTIPLLSGSPAIDAGNPGGCTDGHGHLLKTDQRGKPRPDKEDTRGCDMGAYERQSDLNERSAKRIQKVNLRNQAVTLKTPDAGGQ